VLSVIHVVCVVWPPTRGYWSTPADCAGNECTYRAEWSLNENRDSITFTIAARQQRSRWTGIAFAPDKRMVYKLSQV